MNRRALPAALAACLLASAPAAAQLSEVQLDHGPAADLYIKRRPPAPEAPRLPKALQDLLETKEKQRDVKRRQAIGMLRTFLASKPTGDARAEGLFKLGELLWEDARFRFVADMNAYDRKREACKSDGCNRMPSEPRIDLGPAEEQFRAIITDHPDFRRMDLVLYLVGFATRERGNNQEALALFQQVIKRYPESPLYGDAWMMIGESYFATQAWDQARDAYSNVLSRPDAPTYDLALFKTAWCYWRLNDLRKAAELFKEVLDKAMEAERSGNASLRKRRSQLRDEALEYLVVLFTEDQSISAKEIYEFLVSIGGEQYSRDVIVRVAESYHSQADWGRAVAAFQFLIELSPESIQAAAYQRRIVDAYLVSDPDKGIEQIKVLVDTYGPDTPWAKANRETPGLKKSQDLIEALVRTTAKNFHATAQLDEKDTKKANLALYTRAASTYEYYLARYGDSKYAAEIRFLRAEILFFKMKQYEQAGDEYLAVGRSSPVGEYHKDALLKAMEAFERARPKDVVGKRELLPADRKFAAAVDLYATLFPADPELVGVVFRNGQLFYDYGDYDEAIKRFGLIVTKYPDHPDAGPAGDRILNALVKGQDFENVEDWARKLKKAKAFQSSDQQARLDRLIVESIAKSGEKYGEAGKYDRAAKFYLRVPKEFPNHELAPVSIFNAAIMFEKAKRPEDAGATYLSLADRYPKDQRAAKAAFTAGLVYEKVAYFDRAAEAYEVVVAKYPRSEQGADALFNAGVLRQALGQNQKAIAHFQTYAKRFKDRKDAPEVAFRIGAVYEAAGDQGRAERAFRDYLGRFHGDEVKTIEAHTRAGRAALELGQLKRAAGDFDTVLRLYKKLSAKDRPAATRFAAEARYHQGELVHREYQKIGLDVKVKQLRATLEKKKALLAKAKGIYEEVVGFGDLQWAAAALYRRGAIFEEFAKAMREAPDPPGVGADVIDAYRQALEERIVEIEQIAVARYTEGYQKVIELKVYNKHTRMMREALGRLASSEYPPEHEVRSRVRIGDRPPAPKLVEEVVRGE